MIDDAIARLAARQHGVFSRVQAAEAGATTKAIRHRLARGRWLTVEYGVYRVAGTPDTWHGWLLAACLAAGPGAVASHRSAALLWELDGFHRRGRPEISVPRGIRFRREDIRVHESLDLPDPTATTRQAIPVTGVARTLLDVAAVVPHPRLSQGVDSALRRGLVDWPTLWATLVKYARKGRRGAGPLRTLLDARYGERIIPDSWLERCFFELLRDADVPLPEPQYHLLDGPRFVGRADFAYPGQRIWIELDSIRYHTDAEALIHDNRRQNDISLLGWTVLRFTWRDLVEQPDQAVRLVRRSLASTPSRTPG